MARADRSTAWIGLAVAGLILAGNSCGKAAPISGAAAASGTASASASGPASAPAAGTASAPAAPPGMTDLILAAAMSGDAKAVMERYFAESTVERLKAAVDRVAVPGRSNISALKTQSAHEFMAKVKTLAESARKKLTSAKGLLELAPGDGPVGIRDVTVAPRRDDIDGAGGIEEIDVRVVFGRGNVFFEMKIECAGLDGAWLITDELHVKRAK